MVLSVKAMQGVKVKLFLCLTNKALCHEGFGDSDPSFLDLATSWRSVASYTPLLLYPRERVPLDRRMGGPQSQSGRYEENS
jgi:hypothetical protein